MTTCSHSSARGSALHWSRTRSSARLGGDEFAVIAPMDAVSEVTDELRRGFEQPFICEGLHFDIDASIGSARYPDDGSTVDDLLKAADIAMYVAKEQGRGFAVYDAALDRNDARRLKLLGELAPRSITASCSCSSNPRSRPRRGGSSVRKRWCDGTIPSSGCCPRASSSRSPSRPA